MPGLYLEDIEVGQKFDLDGRTITESDVLRFAGLTGDFNSLHVDYEEARAGPFGRPVAHGMLVMSVAQGLLVQSRIVHGTSLGLAGFEEWRFIRPVFMGDTIRSSVEIMGARRASSGDKGVCRFRQSVRNQTSELVQEGSYVVMLAVKDVEDGQ